MIEALLILLGLGLAGLLAAGLFFALAVPVAVFLFKLAVIVLVGYGIVWLFRPDLAKRFRDRLRLDRSKQV